MNVYLFELDSVRNSEAEIRGGQNALFRETVLYGNTVVLSMNQVVDSKAFWNGISQDLDRQRKDQNTRGSSVARYASRLQKTVSGERPYTEMLVELCEDGMIRTALYGDDRTAAQYLLRKIGDCLDPNKENFHFSMMPELEYNQPDLELLRDAIQYSDLQKIEEQIRQTKRDSDRQRYEFYYHYVRLILLISQQSTAIAPGSSAVTLGQMLQITQDCFSKPNGEIERKIHAGCKLLSDLNPGKKELDRSAWYYVLAGYADTDMAALNTARAAEAVLDLCYNHVVQENISKADMRCVSTKPGIFRKVFCEEMEAYCADGAHLFHCDAAASEQKLEITQFNHREDKRWKRGCSLIDRNTNYLRDKNRLHDERKNASSPEEYCKNQRLQKMQWARLSAWTLGRQLLVAAAYVLLFMLTNYLIILIKKQIWPAEAGEIPLLIDYLRGTLNIVVAALISAIVFRIGFVIFGMQGILVTVQSVFRALWENALLPLEGQKEKRRYRKQR